MFNLCSTIIIFRYSNLNTSHVNVQLLDNNSLNGVYFNLNTSHVNVQQTYGAIVYQEQTNLNTSHVNVQQTDRSDLMYKTLKFKYISC